MRPDAQGNWDMSFDMVAQLNQLLPCVVVFPVLSLFCFVTWLGIEGCTGPDTDSMKYASSCALHDQALRLHALSFKWQGILGCWTMHTYCDFCVSDFSESETHGFDILGQVLAYCSQGCICYNYSAGALLTW